MKEYIVGIYIVKISYIKIGGNLINININATLHENGGNTFVHLSTTSWNYWR